MQAVKCEVYNACGLYFSKLGKGADTEPVFVNICQPETFSSRKRIFQSALVLLFDAEISFYWHSGKTCLELFPVPVTYLYKTILCKFSVVGVKNVNMSELENIMHFLPTFVCVFILLVYNRFGLSSVITAWACGANFPLLQCSSFLPSFFIFT